MRQYISDRTKSRTSSATDATVLGGTVLPVLGRLSEKVPAAEAGAVVVLLEAGDKRADKRIRLSKDNVICAHASEG